LPTSQLAAWDGPCHVIRKGRFAFFIQYSRLPYPGWAVRIVE
jgi:hypothetical protein